MFGHMQKWWMGLPTWAKWVTGISAVFALSSIGPAIRERDPLAFVENFLALTFHYGLIIGSFATAIWGGVKIAEATRRNWAGWVSGIAIFVAFAFVSLTFQRLPGIGSRMKGFSNSDCHIEWDGRSNPTVCD
ncbi:hypothetical protein J2045_001998 [Peteryoungia aggregata LMG 23059]|uniref:Uncharacterized protein n=1 Tax=Peteryoungia aggregata LMG 23059 TaxID=1368425 RepID=A0ABU0G6L6_9HYPH|nr:hypothetical protein [Peteryoungia aggregata]MDQ0420971.1 hypothetical protein [Peteryoungia aggregata LMG 23059]